MKKINFICAIFAIVFFLISCNQNPKTVDNKELVTNETKINDDDSFESFKTNFRPKALNVLNEFGKEFNNHYLAKDDSLIEVAQFYKENFLNNLNTENLYYGFKTKLPNKSVILTFLKHYGAENANDGEVIDTTFFVSVVFSESGKFQSIFRSFGSNLTGEPPTYNMTSTFGYENDKLIITNYEYSTGKSYSEAMPLPDSDSIYLADLTQTKYYLNYSTDEIVLINKSKSTAKVVESYRSPLPVYLRPID